MVLSVRFLCLVSEEFVLLCGCKYVSAMCIIADFSDV